MASSRIILGLLGIIFLIIVILSGRRIVDTIRNRTDLLPSIQNQQSETAGEEEETEITPQDNGQNETPESENGSMEVKETPNTGPEIAGVILFSLGLLSGIVLRKKVNPFRMKK